MPGVMSPLGGGQLGALGVARGGAFSPKNVAGLQLWAEGRLLIGKSDGNVISSFTDQSGLGHHPAQAIGAKQPLYRAAGPNNQPYLQFDGVDDYLLVQFTLNQPLHVFLVYRVRSLNAPGVNDLLFDGGVATTAISSDNTPRTRMNSGGTTLNYNGSIGNAVWAVVSVLFNGASSELRENGTQRIIGDPGANNASGITLGALRDGTRSAPIDIAAAIVYNAAQATTNRQYIERGLGSLYGITVV